MGQGEPLSRSIARDVVLAALVLALLFLNFGHSSAVFAAGGRVVVTAQSICGDQPAPVAGDHFACHACRPALAVLPPPPATSVAAEFAIVPVVYALPALVQPLLTPGRDAQPRGPPAV
ncbi:MAG: hypothetical protein BGO82_08880 [Devosia sp. 67-54]|uniref:hypothetical protein n=1 Tax=unclassified Devosia TaxID=196773 RepID=UPI0009622EE0|nr:MULTISPECIES: hypothetical protein [unclassified Devosia]MBN9305260.1 hypothetical protein [Devosia sp.]OJX14827.1 MAG: hypothetical protein BGO82_08880 [Devosia sp. 67-54]